MRFFGVKATNDIDRWKPVTEAITSVINYARATARLDVEVGAAV